jgi:hypothetical protein
MLRSTSLVMVKLTRHLLQRMYPLVKAKRTARLFVIRSDRGYTGFVAGRRKGNIEWSDSLIALP